MEGGAGSQAGSWPENRASVQVGGRAEIRIGGQTRHWVDKVEGLGQGWVSEPLAFLGLPLPPP